jgi:hypothetical protein
MVRGDFRIFGLKREGQRPLGKVLLLRNATMGFASAHEKLPVIAMRLTGS